MFIGHYAAAFAGKRAASGPSLGTYVLAGTFLDVVFPILILAGVEQAEIVPGETAVTPLRLPYYPFSHSLLCAVALGLVFAGIYLAWRKDRRGAVALGLVVLSHWVLDLITHEPDLPLAPGLATKLGFGLWNSFWGTVLVEGALFVAAVALYVFGTKARDRVGRYGLAVLVLFLAFLYYGNLTGAPPPNATALSVVSLAAVIIVIPWASWVDRHRTPAAVRQA